MTNRRPARIAGAGECRYTHSVVFIPARLGNLGAALHCGLWLLLTALAASCGGTSPAASTTTTATEAPTATATAVPTPVPTRTTAPTPTARPTPTLPATATASATATATLDPFARFSPPDPAAGAADASEALIAGRVFELEIASTLSQRARGLMGRESIPDAYAMLFVYDEEARVSFWMKGTLIPLDILFLDSHGVVVDVQTMTPQTGAPDTELVKYTSAGPARYALEMNAGLAEALGVKPGDTVLFD